MSDNNLPEIDSFDDIPKDTLATPNDEVFPDGCREKIYETNVFSLTRSLEGDDCMPYYTGVDGNSELVVKPEGEDTEMATFRKGEYLINEQVRGASENILKDIDGKNNVLVLSDYFYILLDKEKGTSVRFWVSMGTDDEANDYVDLTVEEGFLLVKNMNEETFSAGEIDSVEEVRLQKGDSVRLKDGVSAKFFSNSTRETMRLYMPEKLRETEAAEQELDSSQSDQADIDLDAIEFDTIEMSLEADDFQGNQQVESWDCSIVFPSKESSHSGSNTFIDPLTTMVIITLVLRDGSKRIIRKTLKKIIKRPRKR